MASESVPDDWKAANVIPVYEGRSRNVTTNYRPISLTSQLCKIKYPLPSIRMQNLRFVSSAVPEILGDPKI